MDQTAGADPVPGRHLAGAGGEVEGFVAALEQTGDFRVLRRLDLIEGATGVGDDQHARVGIAVDVETTGLDPTRDRIIELALRRFRFDADGRITRLGRGYAWLEDPGFPISAEIVRLTGIFDAEVAGRSIDEATAEALLSSADMVVAHNAQFDRRFIEGRLPRAAGKAWACSCREVDWSARGLDGRKLGWLLAQCGFFHGAHRALGDIDGVLAVLRHRTDVGETALREMVDRASTPGWTVRATGASFDVKDALKKRGYRWSGDESVWSREIRGDDLAAERAWLAENVYVPRLRPRADGPAVAEVTWMTRYS